MEKMKVKCSQYWPDTSSQQYAHVNVTLINTIQQADFVIRHFQIKSVSLRFCLYVAKKCVVVTDLICCVGWCAVSVTAE